MKSSVQEQVAILLDLCLTPWCSAVALVLPSAPALASHCWLCEMPFVRWTLRAKRPNYGPCTLLRIDSTLYCSTCCTGAFSSSNLSLPESPHLMPGQVCRYQSDSIVTGAFSSSNLSLPESPHLMPGQVCRYQSDSIVTASKSRLQILCLEVHGLLYN